MSAPDVEAPLLCPSAWSEPTHALTCKYVFPENCRRLVPLLALERIDEKDLTQREPWADSPDELPLREVGGAYYDRIKRDNVIEFQLAQAGIRLAAILNHILAEPAEIAAQGHLKLASLQDDAPATARDWLERITSWF